MYIVFKKMDEWFDRDPNLRDKFKSMYDFLFKAAHDYAEQIHNSVKSKTDEDIKIEFSEVVFKQAIIDGLDDLLRLKNYHPTDEPNPIKEIAYIAYWIVRHKPIRLVTEDIIKNEKLSNIGRTKLLFINEHFGVHLLINSAFEGTVEHETCSHMAVVGKEQMKHFKHFLLYYLTYRVDSPKSLEAIMLSCTIHPIWEVHPVIWSNPDVSEEEF